MRYNGGLRLLICIVDPKITQIWLKQIKNRSMTGGARAWFVVTLVFCTLTSPVIGGPQEPTPSHYKTLQKHHPQSIGKSYMGREIASVMGYAGVSWLERPEREKEENLKLLIKSLKIKPGMTVADFGAGSGVLSLPIAKAVGPKGRVLAIDIQKKMLKRLHSRAKSKALNNLTYILATAKDPQLSKHPFDLLFMVDVYHELEYPFEVLQKITKSMKKNSRIALVEYRAEDPKVPIKTLHKMSLEQIKKELTRPELGLEVAEINQSLPWQHLVFFQLKSATN